ncbi:MAG: M13 family metallopeptidase, partial [Undibacterium sp.]|nr:M13 family metallopeptidase [Undibacterium sp.]
IFTLECAMPNPRRRQSTLLLSGVILFSCIITSCQKTETPATTKTVAPAVAMATVKPVFGSFGIDLSGMDKSQTPGDNFFAYANGNWVNNTEVPADRSSYDSFTLLTEKALARTRAIAEESAANKSASGDTKKIGDYYTAFMDEAGIEAKGLASIQPELDGIRALKDKTELAYALGQTLRSDVDILNSTNYYTDHIFGLWVTQNLDKPNEYAAYLLQGGLGMPDRDFYLEGGRMALLRKQYQAHIAKIMTLAGIKEAETKAKQILALEIAIARTHAPQVDTNDVKKGANFWTRADFKSKARGMNWDAYFDGANLKNQKEFIVWQPSASNGISKLVATQSLDTWKDYLTFHALNRYSAYLPKAFSDERFDFYGNKLNGTPKQQERWKRAINTLDGALGNAVGKLYVARHFSPETKKRADEMVVNLIAAFGQRIDAIDWMTSATKAHAKAKLAGLKVDMGYPDQWLDYSSLQVGVDDALGNAARASLFDYQRHIAKLGTTMDHTDWYLLPQDVNALNVPLENRLLFSAAILEAPFFDAAADDAVNYGAIGAVIGHEITHSFDSSGALFDEQGRMINWWTPEDLKKFDAAGTALVAQYDSYKPFSDLAVNGKLTLAENIADVAGLATAYDAYVLSQKGKPSITIEGFTPEQRVFLGWGQAWRTKAREPAARNAILTDTHAPGQYRAETVRNQDSWYKAFNIKPEQQRYLAPEKRVKVW